MFASTTSVIFALSILGFTSTSAAPTSPPASAGLEARASYDGTATYYYQGGNPGSCGDYHSAVNSDQQSGSCGKRIKITNTKNGKTATALAADTCPTCDYGSLDMSEGLFTFLGDGDMGQGVFPISWHYTSSD